VIIRSDRSSLRFHAGHPMGRPVTTWWCANRWIADLRQPVKHESFVALWTAIFCKPLKGFRMKCMHFPYISLSKPLSIYISSIPTYIYIHIIHNYPYY
jgi:hypothetical protein